MKVLLLGVGAVGSVIARHLAGRAPITSLTLADRDTTRAAALAQELRGEVRVTPVDASDAPSLAGLCRGHDLVINAILPRFNGAVMDAALAAGAHYVDLAAGEEDQFRRAAAWRERGLVAIHGMGEDPGISNVLARAGADRLDVVETIRVRDGEFSESGTVPLACLFSIETFIEEAVAPPRVFEAGAWRTLAPWSGREIYPFPPPVGPQPVFTLVHEEVETLPRFIGKGIRNVDFKLALPDAMQKQLEFLDRIGMTRRDTVRVGDAVVRPLQVLAAVLPQPADLAGKVRGAAIILVEVEGTHDGRRYRHRLHTGMTHEEADRRMRATATALLTGTGGAAGALLIATGRLTMPGVHSPEQVEPTPILAILSELGLEVQDESREITA